MKKLDMKKVILMGIAGGTMLASQGNAAPNSNPQPSDSWTNSQKIAGSCGGKNGCKGYKDKNNQASRDVPNNDNMPQDNSCKAKDGCKGQTPPPPPTNGCKAQSKLSNSCGGAQKNNPVANNCSARHGSQNNQPQNGVYTQWETSDSGRYQNQSSNSCSTRRQPGFTADNSKPMPETMPEAPKPNDPNAMNQDQMKK